MRHGTTIWNEKGIIQGRSQNTLSKNGEELTRKVAKEFESVPFDVIFCSPLKRTVQTANLMNKYHNVKVIKDDRLIEIDQGIFTDRKKNSLTLEEKSLKKKRLALCNMENFEQVYKRVEEFFKFLQQKCKAKTVLVVSHGIPISLLECVIKGQEFKDIDFNTFKTFNNAEVRVYEEDIENARNI